MATISDVATRAGVSTATVSRALGGKTTVDPDLAARVRRAAHELGYRPNALARNLRRRETRVIALIVSDIENPFFTAVARGVEDVARAAGFSVVLCNSDEDEDKQAQYVDVAVQERMAGVVISPTAHGTVAPLLEQGIPVVAVDRPPAGPGRHDSPMGDEIDTVLVDNRAAAREATEHLVAAGYRRIACISGPAGIATADDRVAGYRDALGGDAALVRRVPFHAGPARAAALELLDAPDRPDALLLGNSSMAIGALAALWQLGLRAGRAVGVVTFDDAAWATLVEPPLTVVAQPAREIGAVAARSLLARLGDRTPHPDRPDDHDGRLPARRTVLTATLVPRGSSSRA